MTNPQTTKSNYEYRYERMKNFIREIGKSGNKEAEYMDYAIRPNSGHISLFEHKLSFKLRNNRFVRAWRIAKNV